MIGCYTKHSMRSDNKHLVLKKKVSSFLSLRYGCICKEWAYITSLDFPGTRVVWHWSWGGTGDGAGEWRPGMKVRGFGLQWTYIHTLALYEVNTNGMFGCVYISCILPLYTVCSIYVHNSAWWVELCY